MGILSGFPAIQSNELLAIFAWILRIADSFEDSLQDFPEIVSTENEGKDLSIDWDDLKKKYISGDPIRIACRIPGSLSILGDFPGSFGGLAKERNSPDDADDVGENGSQEETHRQERSHGGSNRS